MARKKQTGTKEKLFLGLFVAFTVIIIGATVMSGVFLSRFTRIIHENVEARMISTAELAAKTIISGDELNNYWTLDDVDERYEEIRKAMQDFADEYGLVYVYYMRDIGNQEEQMILDSDKEEPLDLSYTEDMDEFTNYVFLNKESICMSLGEYNPAWEGIIAAYAPVYDSAGNFVAIVGVDLYDVVIVQISTVVQFFTWSFLVLSVFLVAIALFLLILFRDKARAYENASIAKSEFLSRMSHEIRTPMNAIIGFSRMAEKSGDIKEIKKFLTSISESSAFLLQLINGILDISKIEAGKMQLARMPASLTEILSNIESMLHNQAATKKIDMKFEPVGNIPKYVYCDKMYLTQVIVNLLSNALKFTPEHGKINVNMKLLDQNDARCHLGFSVEDNGIGISKEFLKKIFEAFEQADGGNARKFTGTGLGLNISKLLVSLMGGDLSVESEEGKGSKFSFDAWFDIVKPQDYPEETVELNSEKTVDLKGKTVLVFEDNEINQIVADNALRELGAEVELADCGEAGLRMYLSDPEKYFIILMDIQMPGMDGYETTRQIRASQRKNAKTIPIIAMSANVFREDVEMSLAAGMNAHIGKPFELHQVISTIHDVLKKH